MIDIVFILNEIDSVMYYPILIIVMAIAGLYFTFRTRGVQIRLFGESVRLLMEPPKEKGNVSPCRRCWFQPLQGWEPETS